MKKRRKRKLPKTFSSRLRRRCALVVDVPVFINDEFRQYMTFENLEVPQILFHRLLAVQLRRTVHALHVLFLEVVDVPVVMQRQERGSLVQKIVVVPQLQFF